ncbi:MAG: Thioredoxin reductase [Microgenomates bacterium OLB22]|nr:MAG: Thioredoxin reductase [Microgenomates bacterium OLB22]
MENIVIIGGGPAGLAAAIYNARALISPLVVAGSPPGGQLMLTSDVENYPGYKAIQGPELIYRFREHAEHFGTRFIDENVEKIIPGKDSHTVILSSGKSIDTKAILIATGASAQWLNIPSETRLRGHGVSACATCDGFFFKNKHVAVVGGGDTAMEEALTLTNFAHKVYIIHRREQFRASQIMQKRVFDHEKIEVLWNTEVAEVLGTEKVEGLRLKKGDGAKSNRGDSIPDVLDVQGLFLGIGHKPATEFLKDSGLEIDEKGYLFTTGRCAWEEKKGKGFHHQCSTYKADSTFFEEGFWYQTNIKGIFAAGDVVDYVYRQAATAVGMGVAAALEIERYVGENA